MTSHVLPVAEERGERTPRGAAEPEASGGTSDGAAAVPGPAAATVVLEALEAALPVPVVLLDAAGAVVWASRVAGRRFGAPTGYAETFDMLAALGRLALHSEDGGHAADGRSRRPAPTSDGPPRLLDGERLVVAAVPLDERGDGLLVTVAPSAEPAGRAAPSEAALSSMGLSPRESQVALLAAEGLTISVMAERLRIAENTVQTHLKRLYRKLDVSSRAQLAWRLFSTSDAAGPSRRSARRGRRADRRSTDKRP